MEGHPGGDNSNEESPDNNDAKRKENSVTKRRINPTNARKNENMWDELASLRYKMQIDSLLF